MDEKHRLILRSHQSFLNRDLEPSKILSHLVEILDESDEGEIKAQSTRESRCDKLLEILLTKGPTAFKVFVEALKRNAPHLALVLIEAVNEHQEQEIGELKRKNKELEDKVTKQPSNSEGEKKKKKNKKWKKKTKEAKNYNERSEAVTKAKTDLQAQVNELKNQLETKKVQMREAINEESSKSHRLEEEISGLKSRSMETLRPGRIYNYSGKDFDKRGVVYALKSKFVGAKSSRTRITATRSSDEYEDAKIILENQLRRGIVSATKAKKNSWWRVDLTENYALYLTHYTLRHGQEQKWSVLRNWRLEGSVDGREWTVLKNHKNDHGLGERQPQNTYFTCTWSIDGDPQGKAFRYFRIYQTGVNSAGRFGIYLSGIELYGVLVEIGS